MLHGLQQEWGGKAKNKNIPRGVFRRLKIDNKPHNCNRQWKEQQIALTAEGQENVHTPDSIPWKKRNPLDDPSHSVLHRMRVHTATNVHTGSTEHSRVRRKTAGTGCHRARSYFHSPTQLAPYIHHQHSGLVTGKVRRELSPRNHIPKNDSVTHDFLWFPNWNSSSLS